MPADLDYLLPVPADHRERCRALTSDTPELGRRLGELANFRVDGDELNRLAQTIARTGGGDLTPFRLGILSDVNLDLVVPALIGTAPRHGFQLTVKTSPFGLAVASASEMIDCDAVLIAHDHRTDLNAIRVSP